VAVRDVGTANFRVPDYAYADPGETIRAGQKNRERRGPVARGVVRRARLRRRWRPGLAQATRCSFPAP
jgi:hypothetical protein